MNEQSWNEMRPFFSGGDGSSPEKAVRINMLLLPNPDARNMAGIQLEHAWLERHLPGCVPRGQQMLQADGIFDVMRVQLPSGKMREVYFEISTFFSKEPSPPGTLPPSGGSPDSGGWGMRVLGIGMGMLLAAGIYHLKKPAPKPVPAWQHYAPPSQAVRNADLDAIRRATDILREMQRLKGQTPKIKEDLRPLAGFYTNELMRQYVHNNFTREFLPRYVHADPHYFFMPMCRSDLIGTNVEPTRQIQSRWCLMEMRVGVIKLPNNPLAEDSVFRRVADLSMSLHRVAGHPTALVEMPAPERTNQVFYLAAVLLADADRPTTWPRRLPARVFSLDVAANGLATTPATGLVTEWSREMLQQNHGVIIPAETNAFLQAVAKLVQVSDQAASMPR